MTDARDVITALFALVVGGFVLVALQMVLGGGDVSGLTDGFASFLPGFVVVLVLVFVVLEIVSGTEH